MNRENIIDGYMINSKKVVAEMLYDTIEKYESKTCENCKHIQKNHANDMFWCINEDVNKYRTMDIRVDLDFGCNIFEGE